MSSDSRFYNVFFIYCNFMIRLYLTYIFPWNKQWSTQHQHHPLAFCTMWRDFVQEGLQSLRGIRILFLPLKAFLIGGREMIMWFLPSEVIVGISARMKYMMPKFFLKVLNWILLTLLHVMTDEQSDVLLFSNCYLVNSTIRSFRNLYQ